MYGEEKEKYSSSNLPNTPKGVVLLTPSKPYIPE